jgi:uncharacterized RDD family membrane protein YckC
MEFLPIKVNNRKVYAGFFKRLGSSVVDSLIFMPIMFIFHFISSFTIELAMISAVLSGVLFSVYSIYFHYRFGATIGKMVLRIKVTLPNGEMIGLKQALLRSSVDFTLALVMIIVHVVAMYSVDPEIYLNAGWLERGEILLPLLPFWFGILSIVSQLWFWGELIVLLFNKRKRALHDYIAGTVVICKEFAKQDLQKEAVSTAPAV